MVMGYQMSCFVWKHFFQKDSSSAVCNLCAKISGCKCFSGLQRHLTGVHNIKLESNAEEPVPKQSKPDSQCKIDTYFLKKNQSLEKLAAADGFYIRAITNSSFIIHSHGQGFSLPKTELDVQKFIMSAFYKINSEIVNNIKFKSKANCRFLFLWIDKHTQYKIFKYLLLCFLTVLKKKLLLTIKRLRLRVSKHF